jgi:branched-chain amino acid aminotransferase
METIHPTLIPDHIAIRRAHRSHLGDIDWDHDPLEMGVHTSDHMLVCDYTDGEWQKAEIIPYGSFTLLPTSLAFHYGQTIFEGMKAFRTVDGRVHIFRPDKHYRRLERTAERMCMPVVSRELFVEGLRTLVDLDRNWVPAREGAALYIRPFQIATDTRMRVKISESYRYTVVCSPAGGYFPRPVRVKVERDYVRTAPGGTGFAKCGGNYGGAFFPTEKARSEGYDQVLWTDARNHAHIEESGMMNVFFVIGDRLVTPPLTDTILDGITRDSLITLAIDEGISVEERPISVGEIQKGLESGEVREAFGAGTAAVVSPIETIGIDGRDHDVPVCGEGGVALRLKAILDDIRYGRRPDIHDWCFFVNPEK